jgi:hypothetical protein
VSSAPSCLVPCLLRSEPRRLYCFVLQIGTGRAKTHLPVAKLAEWLMMDSEDEAVQLCVHHGLALVSAADGRAQLSLRANSFITPDETHPRRRSEVRLTQPREQRHDPFFQ